MKKCDQAHFLEREKPEEGLIGVAGEHKALDARPKQSPQQVFNSRDEYADSADREKKRRHEQDLPLSSIWTIWSNISLSYAKIYKSYASREKEYNRGILPSFSMMNSVHSIVWPGYFLFTALHVVGMLAATIGFIFLIVWAVKKLHLDQLKRWGIGLLIVGLLVCGITLLGISHAVVRFDDGRMQQAERGWRMMTEGVESPLPVERKERMMMNDHSDTSMTMNQMVADLSGKTGNDFDKAFLAEMIMHHQGAIDMAKAAQVSSGHAELKAMANAIIAAQQKEIDTMKQWQQSWGFVQGN